MASTESQVVRVDVLAEPELLRWRGVRHELRRALRLVRIPIRLGRATAPFEAVIGFLLPCYSLPLVSRVTGQGRWLLRSTRPQPLLVVWRERHLACGSGEFWCAERKQEADDDENDECELRH